MDEIPIGGCDQAEQLFKRFLAQYDVPAYVRRAQQVQDAYEQLLARCEKQREEWLAGVRIWLGRLHKLAGAWENLRPYIDDDHLEQLRSLHAELTPWLRVPVEPTSSPRVLRRAVLELQESIERFNRRWQEYLHSVDVQQVNALREGYNRYYLLEKECAVRSPRLARQGYTRLPALTNEDLAAALPLLPVPRLRDSA